jgi:hypothetical protein
VIIHPAHVLPSWCTYTCLIGSQIVLLQLLLYSSAQHLNAHMSACFDQHSKSFRESLTGKAHRSQLTGIDRRHCRGAGASDV